MAALCRTGPFQNALQHVHRNSSESLVLLFRLGHRFAYLVEGAREEGEGSPIWGIVFRVWWSQLPEAAEPSGAGGWEFPPKSLSSANLLDCLGLVRDALGNWNKGSLFLLPPWPWKKHGKSVPAPLVQGFSSQAPWSLTRVFLWENQFCLRAKRHKCCFNEKKITGRKNFNFFFFMQWIQTFTVPQRSCLWPERLII